MGTIVQKRDFCLICREQLITSQEKHAETLTHRYNLIVNFNLRHCTYNAQDRFGVRLRVEWINQGFPDPHMQYDPEAGNYYLNVSQKALQELGPVFEFKCSIFNVTYDTIRIAYGSILRGKATMYDKVNNEWLNSEGRVCLRPRSAYYNIRIKYDIKDIICGKHRIPFGFDIIVGRGNLYISRTIVINIYASEGWIETEPISRQRIPLVKWKPVDNVVAPTYRRRIPDQYKVDEEAVKSLAEHEEDDEMKTEHSAKHDEICRTMEAGLRFENYRSYFHNCLWLEENFIAFKIHSCCLEKVHVTVTSGGDLMFNVPYFSERRGALLTGNIIRVKRHGSNEAFEGYIAMVQRGEIRVRSLNERFLHSLTGNPYIDVQFQLGRLPMERKHLGVELVVAKRHMGMLFPDEISTAKYQVKYELNDEDFLNQNIAKNPEQRTAVTNILNSSSQGTPYIVFGPPGTGKTVTCVEAICQILKKTNKRVLVCAPANAHCDMLTARLMKYCKPNELCRAYSFTRCASEVSAELKEYANMANNHRYFGNINPSYLNKFRVVVSTLVFIGKFNDTIYSPDYVFIDEAAQASEPEVCIALSRMQSGGQLILAGDPKQLKPLVVSDVAQKYGLNISLLQRLITTQKTYQDENPRFITMLKKNFRSHPNILEIPNSLFYENKLEAVSEDALSDPISKMDIFSHIGKTNKESGDTENDSGKALEFCAVSAAQHTEGNSPSFFNSHEATMTLQYVKALLNIDISPKVKMSDIGVIAPYEKQVIKLKQLLDLRKLYDVDVGTVETFQGREKRIIILSTVRGQYDPLKYDKAYNLGFLKQPERFNVAITRAISKLVVIGCPIVLGTDEKWNQVMQTCIGLKTYHGVEPEKRDDEEYLLCLENFKKFSLLSEQLETPTSTSLDKESIVSALNPETSSSSDNDGSSNGKTMDTEMSESTDSSFIEIDEKDLEVIEGLESDFEWIDSDRSSNSTSSDFERVRSGSESGSDKQDSLQSIDENQGSPGANEVNVVDNGSEADIVAQENSESSEKSGPNVIGADSENTTGSDKQDSPQSIDENQGSSGANQASMVDNGFEAVKIAQENPEPSDKCGLNTSGTDSDSENSNGFVNVASGNDSGSNEDGASAFHSSESEPELVEAVDA